MMCIFSWAALPSVCIFFWWMSKFLVHFLKKNQTVFVLLSFESSLYICLSHVWFANTSSQCVGCVFILIFLEEQNLKFLIKFNFSMFFFSNHSVSVVAKQTLPNLRPQRFASVFIFRGCIVLGFIFVCGPSHSNFCMWCKVMDGNSWFCMWIFSIPAILVENNTHDFVTLEN